MAHATFSLRAASLHCEMIQTAAIYQQFVIDKRKVSLVMAGLPHNTSTLITNKTVSFLRRSNQIYLQRIEDYEIEKALTRTIAGGSSMPASSDGAHEASWDSTSPSSASIF